ncbi:MAG: toll/interleukin-1 receptor domain-containing protein, partial [Rhodanobacteraceae bacterium]
MAQASPASPVASREAFRLPDLPDIARYRPLRRRVMLGKRMVRGARPDWGLTGMADVFVSYARADKARVAPLVAAIEAKGWSVWWDPEITPGQEFDDQIDAEIDAAKAVLVIWTPTSVASRWVRGEAREAAERGILVPVR